MSRRSSNMIVKRIVTNFAATDVSKARHFYADILGLEVVMDHGVLVFDPAGGNRRVFASGLRNCVGLAVHPLTGDLWCSTNERDDLGDDLVPDFITRVRDGAFYGWPWYYLGANEDPRHRRRHRLGR